MAETVNIISLCSFFLTDDPAVSALQCRGGTGDRTVGAVFVASLARHGRVKGGAGAPCRGWGSAAGQSGAGADPLVLSLAQTNPWTQTLQKGHLYPSDVKHLTGCSPVIPVFFTHNVTESTPLSSIYQIPNEVVFSFLSSLHSFGSIFHVLVRNTKV